MVAVVQFKRGMAGACIFGVIESKLCHWQESYLVLLFEVDKSAEVCFHRAVLSFGLAVYLKMEGSWEPLFDAKKVKERWSEFWGEK